MKKKRLTVDELKKVKGGAMGGGTDEIKVEVSSYETSGAESSHTEPSKVSSGKGGSSKADVDL